MKPIDGVILDFDGTLAPDVPEMAIEILHEVVCRRVPVPIGFLRDFFRTVLAFRMEDSLSLLLGSLGLSTLKDEVYRSWESAQVRGPWTVGLEAEVEDFLRARPRGSVNIFSSAGTRASRFLPLMEIVGEESFLSYSQFPKSDPATWRTIAAEKDWDPQRRLVVDDTPLALLAAKTAGYQTVLRATALFDERNYQAFLPWIDYRVDSIAELKRRFRP